MDPFLDFRKLDMDLYLKYYNIYYNILDFFSQTPLTSDTRMCYNMGVVREKAMPMSSPKE